MYVNTTTVPTMNAMTGVIKVVGVINSDEIGIGSSCTCPSVRSIAH